MWRLDSGSEGGKEKEQGYWDVSSDMGDGQKQGWYVAHKVLAVQLDAVTCFLGKLEEASSMLIPASTDANHGLTMSCEVGWETKVAQFGIQSKDQATYPGTANKPWQNLWCLAN